MFVYMYVHIYAFFIVMLSASGVSIGPSLSDSTASETRIEDGKLLFERRW